MESADCSHPAVQYFEDLINTMKHLLLLTLLACRNGAITYMHELDPDAICIELRTGNGCSQCMESALCKTSPAHGNLDLVCFTGPFPKCFELRHDNEYHGVIESPK